VVVAPGPWVVRRKRNTGKQKWEKAVLENGPGKFGEKIAERIPETVLF
jgi:hypothetical protein